MLGTLLIAHNIPEKMLQTWHVININTLDYSCDIKLGWTDHKPKTSKTLLDALYEWHNSYANSHKLNLRYLPRGSVN